MDSTKDTPCEKHVGLFNGLHRHRGHYKEEGAPVTRPVGVLDPAPPKGCSCVGFMTDSDQILTKSPNPRTATGRTSGLIFCCVLAHLSSNLVQLARLVRHVRPSGPTWFLLGSNLAHLCSNLAQLSANSQFGRTWFQLGPIFGPNLVQHGPKI